jgi:hypothetical protein
MEEFSMARQSKREYLRSIHKRYRQGQRKEKTAMLLEEFCQVCGYNLKYAIWLLSRPLSNGAPRRRGTPHSAIYSKASIAMLAKSGKPRATCARSGSRQQSPSGYPGSRSTSR